MTPTQSTDPSAPRPESFRWNHADEAAAFDHFAASDPGSQRQYAEQTGIPRSTLAYWLGRELPSNTDPQLDSFLRSSCGQAFLRQIVLAAVTTFHFEATCGIRPLGHFIERAGLDGYVATSYTAMHGLCTQLQTNLITYGDLERQRLAPLMQEKTIALVPDENFHGDKPCLVAIEPVSNFILVETYADRRDNKTWTAAIQEGVRDLPVTVVLVPSDEASGLIKCAVEGLEAIHLPELFHGQRALLQPLLLPLNRPVRQASKDLDKANDKIDCLQAKQLAIPADKEKPATKKEEAVMTKLIQEEEDAHKRLEEAKETQQKVVEQVRGIGDDYHPFDRHTGKPVEADDMERRLGERVKGVKEVAEQEGLNQKAHQAVDKANAWVVSLVAMVAWFWTLARQRVGELELSEEGERLVYECVMPGYYWASAARRARTAEERKRLHELSEKLLKEGWSSEELAGLSEEERKEVERVARESVGLFQRSSSCVEGRNGRLALFHHGQGKLSEKKLKALTVVHNYLTERADGTTAAERFFGNKPRDLFAWLLEHMPDLPRPSAKRPKKAA